MGRHTRCYSAFWLASTGVLSCSVGSSQAGMAWSHRALNSLCRVHLYPVRPLHVMQTCMTRQNRGLSMVHDTLGAIRAGPSTGISQL